MKSCPLAIKYAAAHNKTGSRSVSSKLPVHTDLIIKSEHILIQLCFPRPLVTAVRVRFRARSIVRSAETVLEISLDSSNLRAWFSKTNRTEKSAVRPHLREDSDAAAGPFDMMPWERTRNPQARFFFKAAFQSRGMAAARKDLCQ